MQNVSSFALTVLAAADESTRSGDDFTASVIRMQMVLVGPLVAAMLSVIIYKMWQHHERSRILRRATRPSPSTPDRLASRESWEKAHRCKNELLAEQAEWEFNLEDRLFLRPLLADVTNPLTARWLDKREQMEAAVPDQQPPTQGACEEALQAATAAKLAWEAASRHARAVGIGHLNYQQRRLLERARKVLDSSLDPSLTDAARDSYIDKAVTLLSQATRRAPKQVRSEVIATITTQRRHALANGHPRPALP